MGFHRFCGLDLFLLPKATKWKVFYQFSYCHIIPYVNIYQSKEFGRKMNAFRNFRGDKMLDLISVLLRWIPEVHTTLCIYHFIARKLGTKALRQWPRHLEGVLENLFQILRGWSNLWTPEAKLTEEEVLPQPQRNFPITPRNA